MPYLLTTTRPDLRAEVERFARETRQEERAPELRGDQRMAYLMRERLAGMRAELKRAESRHAVATIEEARDWIADQHSELGPYPPHAVGDLAEAGGTIGPLSGGTVIKVELVTWTDLALDGEASMDRAWLAQTGGRLSQAAILDAYNNAAQGERT